jgi:hypothetical protein
MSPLNALDGISRQLNNHNQNIAFASFFILFISALFFVWNDAVLTWPGIDNLPAAKRFLDSEFLKNDFFTNASSDISPRTPFVYCLLALQYLFGNFELAYLSIKLVCILNPALYYLVIARSLKNVYGENNYLFISVAVILGIIFLQCSLVRFLIVAWWPPVWFNPNPQNLAITLSLLGIIFYKKKLLCIALISAATIVHPVVSFLNVLFLLLIDNNLFKKTGCRLLLSVGIGLSIGMIIVGSFFYSSHSLKMGLFTEIYVFKAHPYHYLPSRFGVFSRFSWYWAFAFNLIPLALISVYLWSKDSAFRFNCLLATFSYALVPAIQYVFVEHFKSDFFSALGISRFLMFGPWLLCFFFCAVILERYSSAGSSLIATAQLKLKTFVSYYFIVFLFSTSFLLTTIYVKEASYWNKYNADIEGVKKFAMHESNESDVFMLPFSMPRAEFHLVTNRAIFFGNGFPFNAKYFEEYNERQTAIEGNSFEAHFYRELSPNDFIGISKKFRIDYIVIELKFSSQFHQCKYIYKHNEFYIYTIKALLNCDGEAR